MCFWINWTSLTSSSSLSPVFEYSQGKLDLTSLITSCMVVGCSLGSHKVYETFFACWSVATKSTFKDFDEALFGSRLFSWITKSLAKVESLPSEIVRFKNKLESSRLFFSLSKESSFEAFQSSEGFLFEYPCLELTLPLERPDLFEEFPRLLPEFVFSYNSNESIELMYAVDDCKPFD